ncbi:MAG: MFS transporter [SAR202 cluster bacterium]|nr:MFS transporter [SAR202 cluster bacterium]
MVLPAFLQHATARLGLTHPAQAKAEKKPSGFGGAAAEALRDSAFRYFWGSIALTQLANQMRVMVIAWLVLDMTNSQLWVGLVNGLPGIAIAVLGLLGGVLVDRSHPKEVLLGVRFTMATAAFLTAFLVTAGIIHVWHLLALTFVAYGVNGMDAVASQVGVRNLVSRERLLSALSLTRVANNISQIVGPALGGVVMAWLGPSPALWILVAAFALALAALLRFPGGKPNPNSKNTSVARDLIMGFRYVGRTQHVRWLLILGGICILPASFHPLMPSHIRDTLHLGPDSLGLIIGIYGAGGLIGSVVLSVRKDVSRKGFAMVWSALVWSLCLAGLAFSRSFYLSAACMFVIGIMWSVWMNNLNTLLQTTVPTDMQGRVVAINKIFSQGGMTWLVGGLLAAAIGPKATFLLAAAVFVWLHLTAYWRTPELRRAD